MFKYALSLMMTALVAITLTGCKPTDDTVDGKEMTLSIIKPDATGDNNIGNIINKFESNGLRIAAIKMVKLNEKTAGEFYAMHNERPFYGELKEFMSSGPVVVMVLEGDDAIAKNRKIMGATNPKEAEEGTIRRSYARSIGNNAVHGSDSPEAAKVEIAFFFKPEEIYHRY